MEKKYIEMDRDLVNSLVSEFDKRAKGLGYRGKAYIHNQHEFIEGVIWAIDYINNNGKSCIRPIIWINIMRGERVEELPE
jgi:hypothetical protein